MNLRTIFGKTMLEAYARAYSGRGRVPANWRRLHRLIGGVAIMSL